MYRGGATNLVHRGHPQTTTLRGPLGHYVVPATAYIESTSNLMSILEQAFQKQCEPYQYPPLKFLLGFSSAAVQSRA